MGLPMEFFPEGETDGQYERSRVVQDAHQTGNRPTPADLSTIRPPTQTTPSALQWMQKSMSHTPRTDSLQSPPRPNPNLAADSSLMPPPQIRPSTDTAARTSTDPFSAEYNFSTAATSNPMARANHRIVVHRGDLGAIAIPPHRMRDYVQLAQGQPGTLQPTRNDVSFFIYDLTDQLRNMAHRERGDWGMVYYDVGDGENIEYNTFISSLQRLGRRMNSPFFLPAERVIDALAELPFVSRIAIGIVVYSYATQSDDEVSRRVKAAWTRNLERLGINALARVPRGL